MKETIQENLGVIEGTTAIGADGREALSKRWVAALVQVRNEKAVGKKLTYRPQDRELRRYPVGNPSVERPQEESRAGGHPHDSLYPYR